MFILNGHEYVASQARFPAFRYFVSRAVAPVWTVRRSAGGVIQLNGIGCEALDNGVLRSTARH
jgi:hypothetical protein